MGLKRHVSTLEGVDEKYHDLYTANTEPGGDGFLLDVEDWPDVGGLNRTVRVLRKTEDEYKSFQKALGGRTKDEIQALLGEHETMRNQIALLEDPGKVKDQLEKMTADMKKNYEADITGLTTKLRDTETRLVGAQQEAHRGKIMRGLEHQARAANVLPEFYDDVYLRANQFDEIDGELVVVNDQGEPLRSKRDATQLKPAAEWFDDMAKTKPGWFKQSESGGPKGGPGGRTASVIDRTDAAAVAANLDGIIRGDVKVN